MLSLLHNSPCKKRLEWVPSPSPFNIPTADEQKRLRLITKRRSVRLNGMQGRFITVLEGVGKMRKLAHLNLVFFQNLVWEAHHV
jgi:hypothetical protein